MEDVKTKKISVIFKYKFQKNIKKTSTEYQ